MKIKRYESNSLSTIDDLQNKVFGGFQERGVSARPGLCLIIPFFKRQTANLGVGFFGISERCRSRERPYL